MGIDDVLTGKRAEVLRIARLHRAATVRVFGSLARGEARPDSDVHFLVQFHPDASLFDHVAMTQDLEDLLERKVDVVSEKALHGYIREQVLKEAVNL